MAVLNNLKAGRKKNMRKPIIYNCFVTNFNYFTDFLRGLNIVNSQQFVYR